MDLAAIHERVNALQKEIRELRTVNEEDVGEEIRRERELRLQQILYELARLKQATTSVKERLRTLVKLPSRTGDSSQRL